MPEGYKEGRWSCFLRSQEKRNSRSVYKWVLKYIKCCTLECVRKCYLQYQKNCITVFPSEFQQKDAGITCTNISNKVIKIFDFPNQFLLDEDAALQTCQEFCSRNPLCWGCSLICRKESNVCYSGKWNAISECTSPERVRVDGRHLTSSKPSKNIKHIFFILRFKYIYLGPIEL